MFIVQIQLSLQKNGQVKNLAAALNCSGYYIRITSMHVLSGVPHDAISICLVITYVFKVFTYVAPDF